MKFQSAFDPSSVVRIGKAQRFCPFKDFLCGVKFHPVLMMLA